MVTCHSRAAQATPASVNDFPRSGRRARSRAIGMDDAPVALALALAWRPVGSGADVHNMVVPVGRGAALCNLNPIRPPLRLAPEASTTCRIADVVRPRMVFSTCEIWPVKATGNLI
jgi:hypothetical protein